MLPNKLSKELYQVYLKEDNKSSLSVKDNRIQEHRESKGLPYQWTKGCDDSQYTKEL